MAGSVNKVILIGNLGKDPEVRTMQNGNKVANLSPATSESWRDKATGERKEKTEWHRIVVWGKLAELCNQYLSKGRQAFVEGRLQTRSWDDKDGNKRYMTEINAATVQFIGGPSDSKGGERNIDSSAGMNQGAAPMDMNQDYKVSTEANFASDDIPF